MPVITQNKQLMYYAHNGVLANRPTLLLIHGAGGSHKEWPGVWYTPGSDSPFGSSPVYALDLPGHSQSDPPGKNSVDDYAQDVLNFIEALKLTSVVVAGHSMGGAIAQAIALRQPKCLAGLVLIGTGAKLPVSDFILDGILSNFKETARLIAKFAWSKNISNEQRQQAIERLLKNPSQIVYNDFVACNTFDATKQLDNILVPALVIGANDDKLMPLKNSCFLAEYIPNAQLTVIEHGGHYMMIEQTQQVTAAIITFLQALN